MEFDEQCQPKLKDSVTTQHAGSPTKQEEEEDALPSATYLRVVANGPNNVNRSIIVRNVNYDDDYFPPGFRFSPLDDELIVHYLKKKVMNQKLPHNKIPEVNLYRYHPQHLAERFPTLGERDWYFFTPRDRKYRNGIRPNRAAGDGYWKATGADKVVKHKGVAVGSRKALVFYTGKPPKGDKTNWIMHEFRVNQPPRNKRSADDMRLDDWVLCRIYKKADKNRAKHSIKESEHGHSTSTMVSQASSQPVNDNILSRMYNLLYEESYCDQLRSSIQNGLPELPPCIDASLQNLSNFNGHPQQGLNHEARPLGFRRPPAHSTEGILRSTYLREVNSDPKPRGVEEDIWNIHNFENSDLVSQYGFSNSSYMEFPNLDNILPNIAPNHPPTNTYNSNDPYHPPINPRNNNAHAPNHPPINPHNNNAHAPNHPPINPRNNNAHAPNHPLINLYNNNAPNHHPNNPDNADDVLPNHPPNHSPNNPYNADDVLPNHPPNNLYNADDVLPSHPPNNLYNIDDVLPNHPPNHSPNNPYNADDVLPNHPPNNLYNADDVLPGHPPNNLYNIDDVLPKHPPNNHPPNNP